MRTLMTLLAIAVIVWLAVQLWRSWNRPRRLELMQASLRGRRVAGDFDDVRVVVEWLAGEYDIVQIASAAVKMALQADGNGNGARTAEIGSGIDPALGATERLGDRHSGIRFGLLSGTPDLDGGLGGTDGVRGLLQALLD